VLSSVDEDAANNTGDNIPDGMGKGHLLESPAVDDALMRRCLVDPPADVFEFEKHKGVEIMPFSFPRPAGTSRRAHWDPLAANKLTLGYAR
jgi:hypothetical protein